MSPEPDRRTGPDVPFVRLCENYEATGAVPYIPQPIEQIRSYFTDLEMVDPGLVSITRWRPEPADIGDAVALEETTGAVGRKP